MKNSEQPAYPLKEPLTSDTLGLTKREYFAGLAMQGLLSAFARDMGEVKLASEAIIYADALLNQLETPKI